MSFPFEMNKFADRIKKQDEIVEKTMVLKSEFDGDKMQDYYTGSLSIHVKGIILGGEDQQFLDEM